MSAGERPLLVILACNPLHDTGGGQRSARLADAFLRRGWSVLHAPSWQVTESVDLGVRTTHPALRELPLDGIDWATLALPERCVVVVELPTAGTLAAARALAHRGAVVAYDRIDDWSTSLGRGWYDPAVERAVAALAQRRWATAPALRRGPCRDALLLPNAADPRPPAAPSPLPGAGLRALYVGALWGDWFDWALVARLAGPDLSVCLVGDVPPQVPRLPSQVHLLGLRHREALPGLLAACDVAIVPWRAGRVVRATSPLKVYEYLAAGRPVVSTPLPAVDAPGVLQTRRGFERAVRTCQWDDSTRRAVARFVVANTWDARVDAMLADLRLAR